MPHTSLYVNFGEKYIFLKIAKILNISVKLAMYSKWRNNKYFSFVPTSCRPRSSTSFQLIMGCQIRMRNRNASHFLRKYVYTHVCMFISNCVYVHIHTFTRADISFKLNIIVQDHVFTCNDSLC